VEHSFDSAPSRSFKVRVSQAFFTFSLPVQVISYEPSFPTGFVQLANNGFYLQKNSTFQMQEINTENTIVDFIKTSETSYELNILKDYLDFATALQSKKGFELLMN